MKRLKKKFQNIFYDFKTKNNIFFTLFYFFSCEKKLNPITVDFENVKKITVFKGYSEEKIIISETQSKQIVIDLKKLKEIQGPIKYAKTHKFVVQYKSSSKDTLFTNGTIFQLNNDYYKSNKNLILKYNIK